MGSRDNLCTICGLLVSCHGFRGAADFCRQQKLFKRWQMSNKQACTALTATHRLLPSGSTVVTS